ncbi:centrosomal protein of 290 kDa isoform X3 [Monodelphis domestica]|uniref:centrosomal protein of 290 kDa isoform X3 n=1 Tax=Monodelphis domestica TaxID=13616 RepID=UPI0024E1D3F8|nr:centrosomal protein of 290 kDa isoform X3 [Monodelphis domestica]
MLLDWKMIWRVNPDDLPRQEELADDLLVSISKVEVKDLKDENQENVVHLFRITQSLMKMKAQEVELALEEVEKAGEEQAKFENQLKTKVMKLENELEMAQQTAGGRDTRFLRDEIRQLEKQLEQKDRELEDLEKEMEKEKKVNEQLALRNEEAENENSKLRRENEQLRQDIIDYQKQIDSQKETLLSRRGEDSDYRLQLSKKNFELVQYLDEIQNLTEANEKIEIQNQEMRKNLEESVQEMEKMTDEYNRMKIIVQQTDTLMDLLKKEKDHYRLQVQELTELLKAKNEEDDPVMAAVNAKVEEWKKILASKDDEIIEYQQILHNLKEKLRNAQLDADKNNVMALQQGIQERDSQIKMLTEQVEQYTKEMETNTVIIEDLRNELRLKRGSSTLSQLNHFVEIQTKLQILETKNKDAERAAELAEADAREKDKELVEALKRLKDYEAGIYGLEDAVAEIKTYKAQVKIRDREIEVLTTEINNLELKINDFLDENEDLRERLGLDPKAMIDLTEFRKSKNLKQQQYKAENQVLLKEIESLEEERLELKQKIRKMAQEKAKKFGTLASGDIHLTNIFNQELRMEERKSQLLSPGNVEEFKLKIRSTDKIEAPHKRAPCSGQQSDQNIPERSMILGKLSSKISQILQSVDQPISKHTFTDLSRDSSPIQIRDRSSTPEGFTIRQIYKAPCLQSTRNLESIICRQSQEDSNDYLYSLSDDYLKQASTSHQTLEKTKKITLSRSSLNLMKRDFPAGQRLTLSQKSSIFCQLIHDKTAIVEKSQIVKPKVEQLPTSSKFSDDKSDLKDEVKKEYIPFQGKILKNKLGNSLHTTKSWHSVVTATSHLDPVENLIEQLRKELVFLRSQNELIFQDLLIKEAQSRDAELELQRHRNQAEQNEYLSKELNEKERDLERNRIVITKFQNKVKELVDEKAQLEEGLKEILQTIKEMQIEPGGKGETPLIIPSLEKLVNAIESRNAEGIFDANLHLKAQVDQLIGRNNELRDELKETQKEATNYSQNLAKANLKMENLEKEICLLREAKGSNIVFKGVDLPDGMTPSSANIINSQNEYLIHILQELENKEHMLKKLEDSLEEYNRKFAVVRHQQGLLYKEYLSEKKIWRTESEKLREEKKKLEDQVEQDAVKVKEYNNLLNALQMDADETKKLLSENSRKISVLQVNEKSLIRQYTTLMEMERHLRKENGKQKNELIAMEAAVGDRIGHLQQFKETAIFKIAALQKLIDNSVPLSELELANKQYSELTAKYRDMLQKDNMLVQRMISLQFLECENTSLKEQIDVISKELEITKEKFHTLEQAWEQVTKLESESTMDKAQKALTNSEIVSISKKITMLEMKELNERQRAEHAQKMHEHLRTSLKQVEERNLELETKFSELTKINLAAQEVEKTLRDELAESVSKEVSDADRQRILELEKSEMELKVEVSKLKQISDIARNQVEALNSHQQSREKEVESLRMQVLDYQAQSDEKALIAKLHQHIVALQISEATSVTKLESVTSQLQKIETYNLRLEQKLDEKEQSLYFARLEGRNRAKHLRRTIQSLRRQFSGTLPLAQQEKFSKTMIQLQNDKLQVMQEVRTCQEERRNMENKTLELELKLKGLEELISTLKDARGAQKVIDWHMKMEELRLQELKLNRELVKDKEEMKYLKNVISEYERTISNLEEEIVQQNKFHEEQQMAWDQREVELERQLDKFDGQQNEILSAARKFEEATGSVPDPSLPLPNQLEIALRKIKENVRIIIETRATCKSLEEKLKEKESALWEAEQNVLSRDKIINELRLRLPATKEREQLMAELSRKEEEPESQRALKVAHQTIANMQARLDQKEEVLKKYQHLLEKAREEQGEIIKKHEEDIFILHQKLDHQADSSLSKFKKTAMELMKQPSVPVATNKHFMRLAEMEQTVAEQDNSLCSLLTKMKKMTHEIDMQKHITLMKVKEFESTRAQLEENHAEVVKSLHAEIEDLKYSMCQTEKELQYFKSEVQIQKEANARAPTATMKNLVERLKSQLALKEKQQKALSRALLELRAEMTAAAEERILLSTSQKESNLNVQQIIDRHTRDLQVRIEDLSENLLKCKEALKTSKSRENTLSNQLDELNNEMQKKQKAYNKILREKEELEKENEELKRRIKRLTSGLQSKPPGDNKQSLIDELQKKIKNLESQLERFSDETERKEKNCQEELIRWEEGKKWQAKTQGMRNRLKEKEKEVDTLTKQLNTMKELLTRSDKDKITLQKKLKTSGVTADRVIGAHALDLEKELEELRKTNIALENEIGYMRTQQALPRDSVIEDLHLQNKYLQDKLHALEEQISKKNAFSKSSLCPAYDITTLSSPATKTNKHKHIVFPQKNNLLGNKKRGKKIVGHKSFENRHCQITRNGLPSSQCIDAGSQSDETLATANSEYSKPRACNQLNPSWHTESGPEDNTPYFESGPDGEEEGLNQGYYKNGSRVHENQEEQKGRKTECGQGNLANMRDKSLLNLEEPANGELKNASVNESVNPHAEENTQAENNPEWIGVTKTSAEETAQATELGSDDQSSREQELQKEYLKVSSENIELRFQLEQANKDLPRLKSQVSDMKEMCELLKKEKTEIEKKLGRVRGSGRSGKTVPELEKTIGLMKKVVEKVQKENEYLKRASGIMTSEKMSTLELENQNLKTELEKLKLHLGRQLSMQYEFNAKGSENIMVENEKLHKELKKKVESAEALLVEKNDLEASVKKLTAQLQEMSKRSHPIDCGSPQPEGAESGRLKPATETRLIIDHLEKKKAGLAQVGSSQEKIRDFEKTKLPQTSLTSDPEKQQLKEENKKLKKELENFDPSFFEEIEDMKYNYKEEVKKNIILEEKLKQLCEQFHVELETGASVSGQLEAEMDSTNNLSIY